MPLAFQDLPAEDRTRGADNGETRRARSRARPTLHVVGGAAAMELHRRLLALSGRAARCRLVQGRIAMPFIARRGWTVLGFARLGDYSRERLGIGARIVEESVRVTTALEALPLTTAAFVDGSLSWTATRLLTGIATARDELQWIATARSVDTRTLETTIRQKRSAGATQAEPAEERRDDPRVRWSIRVSEPGLRMWRAARELAERTAGSRLTPARVLELVAAEASGGVPPDDDRSGDPSTAAAVRDLLRSLRAHATSADSGAAQSAPQETDGSTCDGTEAPTIDNNDAPADERPTARPRCDWREGLETRDPQLAAFLAELDREKASGPGPDATGPEGAPSAAGGVAYHWREGLEQRDPELAALLAELDAEKAAGLNGGSDAGAGRAAEDADVERTRSTGAPADAPPRAFAEILADVAAAEGFPWLTPPAPADATEPSAWFEAHMHALERVDPFVIDERLREVRLRIQRIDSELATLLREAGRRRLYRDLGFANLESYVESRLGICSRTAWTLLAIERVASGSPRLADAWRDGRTSTMAAHTILRVLGRGHDEQWLSRARMVTLRRLEAEVDWALTRLAEGRMGGPPPEGLDLVGEPLAGVTTEELQMRARPAQPEESTSTGRAFAPRLQITFFAPKSVCALAEETMLALRVGSEPRGSAFERLLALAMLEWMSAPPHRDPVFERDGWRCAVPGCTSRRNLHDHHIVFRSHGGDHARDNRITVCAAHHLHGLHRGRIRACGRAPDEVVWEMGVRFGPGGGKPLFRTVGDRYASGFVS